MRPPRHRRAGHRYIACTRYLGRGSFKHADRPGSNRLRFSGRLKGRRLAPGRYRLTITPRNPAGRSGATLTASFTIVR